VTLSPDLQIETPPKRDFVFNEVILELIGNGGKWSARKLKSGGRPHFLPWEYSGDLGEYSEDLGEYRNL